MLKGMIRAATLLVGLATAMTAMTAGGHKKGSRCRQERGS